MVIVMDHVTRKLVFMVDKTEWLQMASSEGGIQTSISNYAEKIQE